MRTIKRYMALFLALALIGTGCILLTLDYGTVASAWAGLACALVCLTGGLVLGLLFDKKKMLPE